MARSVLLEFRRGTAAAWTAANPTLAAGEPGYETDTGKMKIGDGTTAWAGLAYFTAGTASPLTTKGDLYGHSTLDARIAVGTDGFVLTADSSQTLGVAWKNPASVTPGTGLNLLFDSTLAADGASIDTGAGGIPSGHKDLMLVITARSAVVTVLATLNVVINNDTGANYDRETWRGRGVAVSSSGATAAAAIQLNVPGDSYTAAHFASEVAFCPAYDVSGGPDKTYVSIGGSADTVIANNDAHGNIATWRSTAAITRMAISDSTGANLRAGSRLCVYGTQ